MLSLSNWIKPYGPLRCERKLRYRNFNGFQRGRLWIGSVSALAGNSILIRHTSETVEIPVSRRKQRAEEERDKMAELADSAPGPPAQLTGRNEGHETLRSQHRSHACRVSISETALSRAEAGDARRYG